MRYHEKWGLARKRGFPLVLFLASLLYFWWGADIGMRPFDEGNCVYAADLILKGSLPYRDFFLVYFPAQCYLLALVFKIFGQTLIVERYLSVITYALAAVLCFAVAEKTVNQKFAFLSWVTITLWMGAFGFLYFGTPGPSAFVFSLVSCLLFMEFTSTSRRGFLFFAGLSAGVAGLFKQEIGLAVIVSETVTGVAFLFFQSSYKQRGLGMKALGAALGFYKYVFGVLLVLLPVSVFFFAKVPVDDLYFDLIQWPLLIWPPYGEIPYPSLLPDIQPLLRGQQTISSFLIAALMRIPYFICIGILGVSALIVAVAASRKKTGFVWNALPVLLLGIVLFNGARGRSDIAHLTFATISALILLGPMLSWTWETPGWDRRLQAPLILISLLTIVSLSLYISKSLPIPKTMLATPQLQRARGIFLPPSSARDIERAASFIMERCPKDAKILVCNVRHDEGAINDIMFYFLAERESATKYYALAPGIVTTERVQREIIKNLIQYDVEYVVVWTRSEEFLRGESSGGNGGARILDDFIHTHYQPAQMFGEYVILAARDLIVKQPLGR